VNRFALSLLLFPIALAVAQPPVVTESRWIDFKQTRMHLRKINGRWWTDDNREVNPASGGGLLWTISSQPGVVTFHHHQPFQLAKAEWLNLFMPADEVVRTLGQPNTVFGMSPASAIYRYYADNGTVVEVRIMQGVVGEAEYRLTNQSLRPVASVQRQLAGRNVFSLLAQRNGKGQAEVMPAPVAQPAAAPSAPPRRTAVSSDALKAIAIGDERDAVIRKLGEPSFRSSLTTDDGTRESLTYHLDDKPVVIRLVNGKVVSVP
jgi:hypothetical protein